MAGHRRHEQSPWGRAWTHVTWAEERLCRAQGSSGKQGAPGAGRCDLPVDAGGQGKAWVSLERARS